MDNDGEMDMNYVSDVMKTMYNFSLNNQFTDFRIRAGEKTVHVHQSVICAKSDFFRAICQSGNSEAQMKNAKGEDEEILSAVRRFMYFGKTTITAQNVEALVLAADFIKNQELREMCETYMMNSLTLVKLKPYQILAQRIELPRLQAECVRFSKDHFSEVRHHEWFLSLSLEDLHAYLQDDELNAPHEHHVLQAMLRWLDHSRATPAGKEAFIERLFPCVRLPFCNRAELDVLCKDPKVAKSLKLGVLEYLNYGSNSDQQPRRFNELSAKGSTARPAPATPTLVSPSAAATTDPFKAARRTSVPAAKPTPNAPSPLSPKANPGVSSAPPFGYKNDERVLVVGGMKTGVDLHKKIIGLEKHRSDPIADLPSCFFSLCEMDDALVVSGGNDFGTDTSISLVNKFCFSTREWVPLPSTPEPVALHGSACVNQKLYTIGGSYKENSKVLKRYASANVLDLTSRKWSKCRPMPQAVEQPGIAVVDAFIFAICGFTGKQWCSEVHKYNTMNGIWQRCQNIPKAGKNTYKSTAVVNRNIYLLSADFFLSYNIDTNAWTELSLPMRPSYYCSMVLFRRCLVVTGGLEDPSQDMEPNDRVQVYDFAKRGWRMENYTMPFALCGHWTVVARI